MVHVSRGEIIAEVWQVQLVCHVLGDPLSQLEWKELQIAAGTHTGMSVRVRCWPVILKRTVASAS